MNACTEESFAPMMRSLFLDAQLGFDTPSEAAESEEILLRILGVVARKNLYYLRRNPGTPKLYSREAGIRWCPPDQMEGCWVAPKRLREVADYLRSVGMSDEHVAIAVRLFSGVEIFQDIPTLYRRKRGDCDRLVAARLAELWLANVMASPYLIPYPNDSGGTTYHAVVLHGDNTTEDPSAILGMGSAKKRAEEIRKNYERRDNLVKSAASLMVVDGYSPEILGQLIDDVAYVPRGGF